MRGALEGFERRAAALLRSRAPAIALVAGGSLAAALAVLVSGGEPAEAQDMLGYGLLLLPLLVAHGMVARDLRSGVALLWLQKPVSPVRFYLGRWLETTAVALLLALAMGGFAAAGFASIAGPDAARPLLLALPMALLLTLCLCTLVYGFSGWGSPLDSLLAVFSAGVAITLVVRDGPAAGWVEPLMLPLDALAASARVLTAAGGPGDGRAFLEVGRFLLLWAVVGTVGTALRTRSPLPRDLAR